MAKNPCNADRVLLGRPSETRRWAHRLAVSEAELLQAVHHVGTSVSDIQSYLKRKHSRPGGQLQSQPAVARAAAGDNTGEPSMPDDKTKTGGQDRKRINTGEKYEVIEWVKKFGVTKEQLLEAVKAVGNRAEDVEAHLEQRSK